MIILKLFGQPAIVVDLFAADLLAEVWFLAYGYTRDAGTFTGRNSTFIFHLR